MTIPQVGDREFRNEVVRIANLTVTGPVIEGYTFSNCRILGPAVLFFMHDVSLIGGAFEADDVDEVFWLVDPRTRPRVQGAVGVRDCTFSNCAFAAIGIAGDATQRENFVRGQSLE